VTDDEIQRLFHDAAEARLLGRLDDAIALLRLIPPDSPLTLDARLRLGELLVLRHRTGEAAAVLAEARAAAEGDHSLRKAATAINLLALNERRRDPDRARRLLAEQEPFLLKGAPGPQVSQWFHYRGLLAADRNEFDDAERLLFRAFALFEEINDRAGLSEVCDSLANLLLKRGNVSHAKEFAGRSLAHKIDLGDLAGQAISYGTLGRASLLQADYDEAERYFRLDLELAESLGDAAGVGIMLNSLGETALMRADYSHDLTTAADYYLKNLARDAGAVNTLYARLGLARVRLAQNDVESATDQADRMAEMLDSLPAQSSLRSALVGLRGAIAGRRGDDAGATCLLCQAVAELQRDGFHPGVLPWLYELRDLHQRKGRTADAVGAMSQALDLLNEMGADETVSDVEQWLREVDAPALTRLALRRHFPDHLVAAVQEGRLTHRARREASSSHEITVLFSDVRDYTSLSEGLDPRDVLDLLNGWFAEATRVIRRHNGFVDKFIGDAVMAIFGVPRPRDDAAADAVRAALGMRDALAALNLRNKAMRRRQIRIGVGVYTGEAVVGFVGSHLRLSYTAIGDTVNTAARLESATKDFNCDVLIGQATELAQRKYQVAETTPRGLAKLKGKEAEVPVYEVIGWRQP
jgi:class 3 adenylate cyclase